MILGQQLERARRDRGQEPPAEERRGGGFKEGPQDSITQYAQRTGETVSGMKTTAGGSERGHKGRAACLHPLVELRTDKNLSLNCQLPVHIKATVHWYIWI
ncbi:hypothetical protein DPMN_010032 [Dreissena polymorpha]|uniref:Uncharacterized protein n=1 Tax=Dreissena polymorpha TaxID=45954 RepID=A0A9D4N1I0_DREPO|nr:hypothetical protein DPMN_010032 [Dreissena polymorpha]